MMVTEAQEKQRKRDAVAATQADARSEVGRLIIQHLSNKNNAWTSGAEFKQVCSGYDRVLVSNRLTTLTLNHTLEADKSEGIRAYKYRLAQQPAEFVGPMQPEPSVAMETVTVQEVPEGVKGRKSKVVWSHDERITLAHEVATIRKEQPFISLGGALDMAQIACLPKERHRIPIGNIKVNAAWLADMVDLVAANTPVPVAHTEPKPAPAPTLSLADFSAGQLLDALLDKFNDKLKSNILEIIQSPEVMNMLQIAKPSRTPVVRHNPIGAAMEPKVKLERILIAGLLKPMHVEEVKEKFGDQFDLKFYHPDESVHKLKSMAPGADRVILMATQLSHKHEESLRTTNVKFEKVRGNIGVLLARLNEIKSVH